MQRNDVRRRHVLAGVGACGVVGLAGCSALPFVGDGGRTYAKWMRSGASTGQQHLDVSVVRPSALERHRSAIPDAFSLDGQPYVPRDRVTDEAGFGVDYADVDAVVGVGRLQRNELGSHVLSGPYDRAALDAYLAGANYEHHSTYEGFDVWGRHVPDIRPSEGDQGRFTIEQIERGQAVAFDGDLLVTAILVHYNQVRLVEATIDALRGNTDRYAEANDDGDELLDHLDGGQVRAGWTHEEFTAEWASAERGIFEGQVARGIGFDVRGESTHLRVVRVFADPDDVDLDAIDAWVNSIPEVEVHDDEKTDRPYEDFDADVDRRGRSVVVTGSMPTAALTTGYWP